MRTTLHNSVVRAVRWSGQTVVVDVGGDVDFASSRVLEESLLAILRDKPRRIVVNLGDVVFMNTAGVATLVILLTRAHKRAPPSAWRPSRNLCGGSLKYAVWRQSSRPRTPSSKP